MYILYGHPYSQHSRKVVTLLEEVKLPYEFRTVNFDEDEQTSPAYLKMNPNHQVPVLRDGAFTLYESNAILRYLCSKHELDDWYPTEFKARALTDQWLDWGQTRLSPAVVDIVFNKVFLGEKGDKAAIKRGEEKLAELTPILDAGLTQTGFLTGSAATIADLSLAASFTQLGFAEAAPDTANIANWYKRMIAMAGFSRALPEAA